MTRLPEEPSFKNNKTTSSLAIFFSHLPGDPLSEKTKIVEMHGCIVCGRVFNLLAVYSPEGGLLNCTLTGTGGHCLPDEKQPLVVCNTHTADQIEVAHKRWRFRKMEDQAED